MISDWGDKVRVVYRAKTPEEALRRETRARSINAAFIHCGRPTHQVVWIADNGKKVRVRDVEMVFNDVLLMDAVSNYGEDGPLTKDTYAAGDEYRLMREIYNLALTLYAGVTLPECYRFPPPLTDPIF